MSVAADQLIERQDTCRGGGPVAASTVLYAGTLAFEDANGYFNDDTASGANKFAGVVITRADNSGGSAGDVTCELHRKGRFLLTGASFAQTSVGKKVHASDNYTLTLTPGAATCYVGVITEYLSSTKAVVEIDCERSPSATIDDVDTGTINSGDATTDTVITSCKTRINAILALLEAQGLQKPA